MCGRLIGGGSSEGGRLSQRPVLRSPLSDQRLPWGAHLLWLVLVLWLVSFLVVTSFAQDEPTTAEQVIARYRAAIGAERFASITTFEERGELYGNIMNFWAGARARSNRRIKNVRH